MRKALVAGLVAAAVASTVAFASPGWSGPASANGPVIDPTNFVRHVTNPFFPLKPGTLWVYRGIKDGKTQIDRARVTHQTENILGVHATVVLDVATQGGRVIEQTFDWYAQDKKGNVWYLGEDTKAYEANGTVSTEGSWRTGVHGAVPGLIMEADPQVADGYRQEFWKGHAEDQAWILARGGAIHVPFGTLDHALKSMEWTPLEPNVIDKKVYARGFGLVSEKSQTGPLETAVLIRLERPHA